MKGDFTRDTFDPRLDFYRVMLQQGRVQIESDWNEQIAILLHRLEAFASDVFGPYGGPEGAAGFNILYTTDAGGTIEVTRGRYYVQGLMCENDKLRKLPVPSDTSDTSFYICYLDAYEQYVAGVQEQGIRDVALGGLDTAGRSRVRCDVKFLPLKAGQRPEKLVEWNQCWQDSLPKLEHERSRGLLRARKEPSFGYSGPQNQLYRVEIHDSGPAGVATWKWSRENGSVVFQVTGTSERGVDVLVGPGQAGSIVVGDWVEITSDDDAENALSKPSLLLVTQVDEGGAKLEVDPGPPKVELSKHPVCRRWDQRFNCDGDDLVSSGGTVLLSERRWHTVESGVEVLFALPHANTSHYYCGGDYWQVPARTATASIEWPTDSDGDTPLELPPRGVTHRYAPLAGLTRQGNDFPNPIDLRVLRGPLPPSP